MEVKTRRPHLERSEKKLVRLLILKAVHKKGTGWVPASKIAKKTGFSPQQIANQVRNLEAQGFMVRTRQRDWRLTDLGKLLLKIGQSTRPVPRQIAVQTETAKKPATDNPVKAEVAKLAKEYVWLTNDDSLRRFVRWLEVQ